MGSVIPVKLYTYETSYVRNYRMVKLTKPPPELIYTCSYCMLHESQLIGMYATYIRIIIAAIIQPSTKNNTKCG